MLLEKLGYHNIDTVMHAVGYMIYSLSFASRLSFVTVTGDRLHRLR